MSRLLLAAGLLLLLLFAYLTAIRSAYVLVYGLTLVLAIAYFWPRQVVKRIRVSRRIDAGTPTVGEAFEEAFTAEKTGWVPAPWSWSGGVIPSGRRPWSTKGHGTRGSCTTSWPTAWV